MSSPPSSNNSVSSFAQAGSDHQPDPLPVANVTPPGKEVPADGQNNNTNTTCYASTYHSPTNTPEKQPLETEEDIQMATSRLPPRRRRKPVHSFSAGNSTYTLEEERLIQQAIENSKMTQLTHGGRDLHIPLGPTFYPTVEEFEGNPLTYISKIKPIAEKYGVCKIVPPAGWNPPFSIDMEKNDQKFSTKEQLLHRIQEGISFGDGEEYCIKEYIEMAMHHTRSWIEEHVKDEKTGEPLQTVTPEFLERCYWDLVEISHEKYTVEYGNDVDSDAFGSGFPLSDRGRSLTKNPVRASAQVPAAAPEPEIITIDSDEDEEGIKVTHPSGSNASGPSFEDLPEPKFGTEEFYKESYWNLNNIPNAPESILQHIKVGINGINVPWMYFGNLFSSFCWHNEDNYLYSINYHHWGAPKMWYGVPGTKKDASGLEQVFKSQLSLKMRDVPDLLHHITTMFSPRLLQTADVPVYKLVQHPGEFVVTFPRAFHGGFSLGPNAGEAVNFASPDWIAHGADANERYRSFARPAVFSHDRLTFTMANNLKGQNTYHSCKLLLAELKRVINEEISSRKKLLDSGVRDISKYIDLPQNRLDQLDEESADYDDKRLCHSCKHICFFSCIACECSKSKVSCLRHSHYMCRCPIEKKYMMIWSDEKEMNDVYEEVRQCAERLKLKEKILDESNPSPEDEVNNAAVSDDENENTIAPGAMEDEQRHSNYVIDLSKTSRLSILPKKGDLLLDFISGTEDRKRPAKYPVNETQPGKRFKSNGSGGKDDETKADITEGSKNDSSE